MDSQQRPGYVDGTREVRAMRVLDEYLRRRAAGEVVSPAALVAANPDLADELRAHLEVVTCLQPGTARIAELIARGILGRSDDPRYAAVLGPYKITGFIGRGGMGIVLQAYEESLARTVALKVLRPDLVHDETALARFTREAKTAAALKHPNIVTIHAISQEGGVHYIAMEFVDGESLADVIRRQGPLPAALARRVFRDLLSALEAAHAAGLIHRDVKSANILLSKSAQLLALSSQPEAQSSCQSSAISAQRGARAATGPTDNLQLKTDNFSVKLADFGLARMRSSQTKVTLDGSVLGTPEYMSPEQARGDADLDHRTDLYSAGVVLYEMLTGQTPFHADTPTATIRKILDEEPRDPQRLDKSVDPVLSSLALRLMAKRREDRLAHATEVLRALEGAAPVRATRPRRHRRLVSYAVVVVGAVALVALFLGYLAFVRGPHLPPRIITKAVLSEDRRDLLVYNASSSVAERVPWLGDLGYTGTLSLGSGLVRLRDGRQLIALGCFPEPLDGAGSSLIAFDSDGHELWRLRPDPGRHWPDAQDSTYWVTRVIASADIDGTPGDELIAVFSHPDQYPTCLAVIDPETGDIRSRLWHFGNLDTLTIMENYFADHRPAIVTCGQNNKLDGFEDGMLGAEQQFAHWDKVWIAMVVHPDQMEVECLAPPLVDPARLTKLGWPPVPRARVWAYAFFDLPVSREEPYVLSASPRRMQYAWRESMPNVFAVGGATVHAPTLAGAKLELRIVLQPPELDSVSSAFLQLDDQLALLDIAERAPVDTGKRGTTKEFWQQYWHVSMRDGICVVGE